MRKSLLVLLVLMAGLLTAACSFRSELSLDKSISGSKEFGKTQPTADQPAAAPSDSAKKVAAPSSNGKACRKDDACNKRDELCVFSRCQSVGQLRTANGFNDDFSNDPCEERPCVNCAKGTQKKTGIGYGFDDVEISASACVDCQFNDECNAGFRCVSFECIDPSTNDYCDFMQECLEGYSCEANKCVKQ